MALIIKFVYSFPLSFTGKLIITEERRKSSHLVAFFFMFLRRERYWSYFIQLCGIFFSENILGDV